MSRTANMRNLFGTGIRFPDFPAGIFRKGGRGVWTLESFWLLLHTIDSYPFITTSPINMRKFLTLLILLLSVAAASAQLRPVTITSSTLRSGSWHAEAAEGDSLAVTLAPDVTEIPPFAFEDCRTIARFDASASTLKKIGSYAFLGCTGLREVMLPASLTTLGEGCFRECTVLTTVSIPSRVTEIPPYCFLLCERLRDVSLPATLKEIGRGAFQQCAALEEIRIPSRVAVVGMNAFSFCTSLRELSFPSSVRELGSYVASECTSLERATLPGNDALLGELMFSGCRSLRLLREPSLKVPPFDCNSFIFEPDEEEMYSRCVLEVKTAAADRYRRSRGWDMFRNIKTY